MKLDRNKIKKLGSILSAISILVMIILVFVIANNNGNEELINVYIVFLVILVALNIAGIVLMVILFRKIKDTNSEILKEYGTQESKTKRYEIIFTGFEYFDDTDIRINSNFKNNLTYNVRRISLFFYPEGFCTNEVARFKWDEVKKIIIDREQDHIQIVLANNEINADNVFLPFRTDIYYLIKTFYNKEIENDFI